MSDAFQPVRQVARTRWRGGSLSRGERAIPEETAIAFTYNRFAYAVMMATPADLEDFAVGFTCPKASSRAARKSRTSRWCRATRASSSVCGSAKRASRLSPNAAAISRVRPDAACAASRSLAEAMRPPPHVASEFRAAAEDLAAAVGTLTALQRLHRQTSAVHAAAFWQPGRGIIALREDVGRHNALDKLAGALARSGTSAAQGAILLTSRVSVEMIQKAAVLGAPLVAAVSAPTALALRLAEEAGITLVGIARDDGFEVFTHRDRIAFACAEHVA